MPHFITEIYTLPVSPYLSHWARRQCGIFDDLWIIDRDDSEGSHEYLMISAQSTEEALQIATERTQAQYSGDWTHIYSIISTTCKKDQKC